MCLKSRPHKPAVNLGVNVLPSFTKLIGFLFVPVQVKIPLIVGLKHAVTYDSGFLQLIFHVMKHLLLLIYLCPPLLKSRGVIFHTNKSRCESRWDFLVLP